MSQLQAASARCTFSSILFQVEMPLGDSPTDNKSKSPLKKAIAFLSPLLIVSAGLHGLAMLLPVPEPEVIEEEVMALPEAIQVSELPEIDILEPEPEPAPVFAPAPVPQSPVVTPPTPVQQPIVVIQQPEPIEQQLDPIESIESIEQQTVEPQKITPDSSEKESAVVDNSSDSTSVSPTGSGSEVRVYRQAATMETSYLEAISNNLLAGAYSDGMEVVYESVREGEITFTLPAGDNCFAEAEPIDANSVMLPTSLMVVVQDVGDKGLVQSVVISRGTGYTEADNLISDAALDDGTLREFIGDWLRQAEGENGKFVFKPPLETLAYNIFTVNVVFDGHSCPETGA